MMCDFGQTFRPSFARRFRVPADYFYFILAKEVWVGKVGIDLKIPLLSFCFLL